MNFCIKKTYKNPLYTVYAGMKKRCYTTSCTRYKNYGEKGIKVCDEWNNNFSSFVKWSIENGYFYETNEINRAKKMSIDRIDSSKDYCPNNCRWITVSENSINALVGRKVSESTKEKISIAHKGKSLSKEHKNKLSLSHLGKLNNNTHAKKGVYKMFSLNGDLLKVFQSPKEIQSYFNKKGKTVCISVINQTAHHKSGRTKSYGYKWEYELCR